MRTFTELEDAPDKAFQKLILEHVLAHSKRRAIHKINLDDFKEIEEEYSVPLKQMFQFYGGAASKEALKEASSAAASSDGSSSSGLTSSGLLSSSDFDIDELEEIFHEVDEGDHGDGYIDPKIIISESTKKGMECEFRRVIFVFASRAFCKTSSLSVSLSRPSLPPSLGFPHPPIPHPSPRPSRASNAQRMRQVARQKSQL